MAAEEPRRKQERRGTVVSDKMDKTIVIAVDNIKPHPRYKKVIRSTKRFKAHDENNEARVGDTVLIRGCRPLSRSKSWYLVEVLEQAK